MSPWFVLANPDDVPSPALLVYRRRLDENLRRMVAMARGPDRLRPHVKTHKAPQIVEAQLAQGITRFKCATIAEAEMTAQAGAPDVLLAYQPVGPNVERLVALSQRYRAARFSTLVDNEASARAIDEGFRRHGLTIDLLIDLDTGMHRSGIEPGEEACRLYRVLADLRGVRPGGLHAYDGHLRDADPEVRRRRCDEAFAPVTAMAGRLREEGLSVPCIVAGGSPTFPFHAARPGVECSPGTTVYWDACYGGTLRDLEFLQAAMVLTRVVSKPGGNRVCLDLGHKAIASENPHPRVVLYAGEDEEPLECDFVSHSEEHLVFEAPSAGALRVGDVLYGIPWHICPTVALYAEAVVIEDGAAGDRWAIRARARRLSV